jgi:hypothetical protein
MAFSLYSTEATPTTTPETLSPAAATLITLDQDPLFGSYDPEAGTMGRGSQSQTLGGVVVQDFGVCLQDQRIKITDDNALSQATVDSLRSASAIAGGEYFFTDGYEVWKVAFLRPGGFRAWRNMLYAANGVTIYSYEMNLIILEELKLSDFGLSLSVVVGT